MKRDLCQSYRGRATQKELHSWLSVARSSGYYKPSDKKRGCRPSTHTLRKDGSMVSNQEVVDTLLNQDENMNENVLNLFEKSVQKIRG